MEQWHIRNGMLTYNADQSEITISGNNNTRHKL